MMAEDDENVYDPRDYGAKVDGVSNDTDSVQKAIDAAQAAGGGVVRLHAGMVLGGARTPGPHQHRWWLLQGPDGKMEVMPNSSCDICGLTPEAVANAAAINTLHAEISRLNVVLSASETEVERLRTEIEQLRARIEKYNALHTLFAQKEAE